MDEDTIQDDTTRSLARVGLSRRYNSKTKKKGNYLISSPAQPMKNIDDIQYEKLPPRPKSFNNDLVASPLARRYAKSTKA